MGDIWAQVAACKMLEERLRPLLRDTDLDALGTEIRRRSEAAMRKSIRAVPDGVYHAQTRTTVSRSRSSSTARSP